MKLTTLSVCFAMLLATFAWAQQPAPKPAAQPGAAAAADAALTHADAQAILDELRKIRALLEKNGAPQAAVPEPPQNVKLKVENDEWLGSKDAPVTIVEFADYQCPFCQRFHNDAFPELRKRYVETGKVRFASRDLPLEFHSNAFSAAEATRCAGDQGQYWQMRDLVIAHANELSPEEFKHFAGQLKLRADVFANCMDKNIHREAIQHEASEASTLHIDGTPSFVIGRSTPEGVDGAVTVGALPISAFEEKMKQYAVPAVAK